MAFTSVHASNSDDWYFDSGYSRHIIESSLYFTDLKECNAGHVSTFGDGVKGKVVGKGNINRSGAPALIEVRLVEG